MTGWPQPTTATYWYPHLPEIWPEFIDGSPLPPVQALNPTSVRSLPHDVKGTPLNLDILNTSSAVNRRLLGS